MSSYSLLLQQYQYGVHFIGGQGQGQGQGGQQQQGQQQQQSATTTTTTTQQGTIRKSDTLMNDDEDE